jgi:predicted phage-related endonuclease
LKIHSVLQGSQEWLDLRRDYFTASEAAAMMGASPYMTRAQLLDQKASVIVADQSDKQNLFDKGHAAEAAYRPIAEKFLADDLYPVTGSIEIDGLSLLASFDGLTMNRSIGFEHKLYNQELADQLTFHGEPHDHHIWQLEQQLLVSGAERILFVTSDGSEEGAAQTMYASQPKRRARLIEGWKLFAADLAKHKPAAVEAKPVGKPPNTLPALHIVINGAVQTSNLAEFKQTALTAIQSVNRDLQTDQHFADAEKSVKWCSEIESRIRAAKEHALGQTASIDDLFRTMDEISAEARTVRLDLEKLVKNRKESIKLEIVNEANVKLKDHIAKLDSPFPISIQSSYDGMKGLKTVDSLRNAADKAANEAIVNATILVTKIKANKAILDAAGHEFLFSDKAALCMKDTEDLEATIATRVAAHQARENAIKDAVERKAKEDAEKADQKVLELAEAEEARRMSAAQAHGERVAQEFKVQQNEPQIIPKTIPQTKPKTDRPTDIAIIEAISLHFRVHESKALEWVIAMDIEDVSKRIESEFA